MCRAKAGEPLTARANKDGSPLVVAKPPFPAQRLKCPCDVGRKGHHPLLAAFPRISRASLWEAGAAIDLVALTGENVQPIAEAIAALDCALRPLSRRR